MAMLDAVTELLGTVADILMLIVSSVWLWLDRPGFNPLTWNGLTWVVAGLCLLIVALLLRGWFDPPTEEPRVRVSTRPDLLISKGSVQQLENSSLYYLNFTIRNLGNAPVQLLELVVKTSLNRPIIVEAIELLLPQEMVELEAPLHTELLGDGGSIQVFAYVSHRKAKLYNLRARLVREAPEKRFKISPTGQSLQMARRLDSERLRGLRRQTWQAQNPQLKLTPPPELAPQPEPAIDPKKTQTTVKVKKTLDLDFPTKF